MCVSQSAGGVEKHVHFSWKLWDLQRWSDSGRHCLWATLEFYSLPVTDIHTNSAPFGRGLITSLPTPQGKTSSAPIHICISISLMGKYFCFKCFSFKLVATSFQLLHWINYMKSSAHVHFYICMRGLLTEKFLTLRVFEGSWNSPHWVPLGFLWLEVRTRTNPALPFR